MAFIIRPTPPPLPPPGVKHDSRKPRWSLLPKTALHEIVQVLEFGATKYAPDNWQRVPDARTRYYDALMRHVEAWWNGEKTDPETGLHHLAHAGCCVLFLLWLDKNGPATASDIMPPPRP